MKKTILYFSAAWCGPCRTLGPIMDSVANEVAWKKIDVDTDTELSAKYGIRNIPSLVLVDENGNELGRRVGVQSKEDILSFYNG
jgi:thioredoxin 1